MKVKRAFTLIELLIAVSIFSVVILSVYSAFQSGVLSYNKIESALSTYQKARAVLNRLESDLKNSFAYAQDNSGFKGGVGSLEFFSLVDLVSQKGNICPEVSRIKYAAEDRVLKRFLILGPQALKEEVNPEGGLIFQIKEISFRYAYATGGADMPYDWQDAWPKEGDVNQKKSLPLAVKIKLSLAEKNKSQQEPQEEKVIEFIRLVPLPQGGLDP